MRISFANTQHVDALIKCCMMAWLSASRMSAQSEPAATPVGRPLRALPAQRTAAVLSLKSGDAPIAHPPLLGDNKDLEKKATPLLFHISPSSYAARRRARRRQRHAVREDVPHLEAHVATTRPRRPPSAAFAALAAHGPAMRAQKFSRVGVCYEFTPYSHPPYLPYPEPRTGSSHFPYLPYPRQGVSVFRIEHRRANQHPERLPPQRAAGEENFAQTATLRQNQ
jgi:hypothetical protein